MRNPIDQLIILILSLTLYITHESNIYVIIPVLLPVIIINAFINYFESDKITMSFFFTYIIICFFIPAFSFFLPLICYNASYISNKWLWLLSFLPLMVNYSELQSASWLIAAFIITANLLKYRSVSLHNLKKKHFKLRDNTKEISLQLEKQNKELLEKQNYETNLATVTERNRIARDIHDNVGHLLSSSILQIGALLSLDNNKKTRESLNLIKDTLSEAMDSIRASVHNLHEESIDLQTEIYKLTENFTFCPIKLNYEMKTNPEKNIKYCFIAVTKEALANIIKHSNATRVSLRVREHPGLYQLVITDNGTNINFNPKNGIGMKNIRERVKSLDGYVRFNTENGFRIFISIPK